MRTRAVWLLVPLALALAFIAGTCFRSSPQSAESEQEGATYTCSMHPQIRNDGPGSCPICGMDLIPLGSGPSLGPNEVELMDRAAALAQLRTAAVERLGASPGEAEQAGSARPLVARAVLDESAARDVTAWIGGRIDRLLVRETGQTIRRGQTVAMVFSPEVLAAHRDVRAARGQLERLAPESLARRAAEASLEAARDRLRLLGFTGSALERLERSDGRRVPVRATAGGTVLERVVTQGQYVQPGAVLLRVASLDPLWVELDAYASDLPALEVGAPVTLRFHGLAPVDAAVSFVDPVVDPRTHVARVRVEVPNEDGALRPGMVGEALLRSSGAPGGALVVPRSAPLHTGRRAVVYVAVPGHAHRYEARSVELGPAMGERVVVRSGLDEGERVVTHGAFVLDAELEIRGGESMMTRAGDVTPLSDADAEAWRSTLDAALEMAQRFAADDLTGAKRAAAELRDASGVEPFAELARLADAVARAEDIDAARIAFEPATGAVERLLERYGNPLETPVRRAMCPMAFDNRGATWIQRGDVVDNPYFGNAMRTCGSIERSFEPIDAAEPSDADATTGHSSMAAPSAPARSAMRNTMRAGMRSSAMTPTRPTMSTMAAMAADPHAHHRHHHHGGS